MTDAIRAEWIKLRTVRANLVLIILAIGAPLVISVLIALFSDFDFQTSTDVFESIVLGPTYVCGFLAGVLGVLGIGQEYRHNTIRVTFAAQPRRSTVLAAKAIVNGFFGLYIGLATPILCFGLSGLIVRGRDYEVSLVEPRVHLVALLGQGLFCGLMTLMGFGLGCVMRQPAGTIPTFLLWPLVAEGIIAGIFSIWSDAWQKWLPFRAGVRMGIVNPEDNALARLPAGLYFTTWVAAVVAFGWWLAERRDA